MCLLELPDSKTAKTSDREQARQVLETRLVHLKELLDNPDTPANVRRDIEKTLRKFRQS